LRRQGLSREVINALKEAYRIIFQGSDTVGDALDIVESRFGAIPEVKRFTNFIRSSKRGVPMASNGEKDP
ncbi:MAG: acyl-[acyl-carrier-protein]--UDP-N-acetylglucosamine O-acyltransferase, partial [Deltaproteobacteria bacterium]|nr:acyl-[acyl-carrier-protein]--UDP-N-acetylglucosamine O-acyltransferase [Deltaproteobacteria bacterium]